LVTGTGKNNQEVAEVTGYGLSWIYELVQLYRSGPGMLEITDHNRAGPLLDDVQQKLWQALQERKPMVVCGLDRKLLPG